MVLKKRAKEKLFTGDCRSLGWTFPFPFDDRDVLLSLFQLKCEHRKDVDLFNVDFTMILANPRVTVEVGLRFGWDLVGSQSQN
jgi:hypothetical protein